MNPWITTYTGRRVDLLDPQPNQIDIRDIAAALSRICRFNGHTRVHYSVAQHSVIVARSLESDLQMNGLFHDAHEAYIGDWSTPLKRSLSPLAIAELRRLEARLIDCIGAALGVTMIHHPAIKEADLRALALEAKSLMAGPIDFVPSGFEVPAGDISPWPAPLAERIFLREYARLRGAENSRQLAADLITIAD